MRKILIVILLMVVISCIAFADDLVIYKSEWQDETTQGYHVVGGKGMKQEVYFNDDSIATQSDLLEKMFTTLYGDPIESKKETTIILRWETEGKEIFLKKDDDFLIIQISDITNNSP